MNAIQYYFSRVRSITDERKLALQVVACHFTEAVVRLKHSKSDSISGGKRMSLQSMGSCDFVICIVVCIANAVRRQVMGTMLNVQLATHSTIHRKVC